MTTKMLDSDPEWVKRAFKDMENGVCEIPGAANHNRIMEMYKTVGHPEIKSEATSWCAAGMGTWLTESGFPTPPKKTNLTGISYESYGQKLTSFKRGCICTFYYTKAREKDWRRHVTIALDYDDNHVICLGANQADAVNIKKLRRADLTSMRWPIAPTVKELKAAGSTEMKMISDAKKGVATAAGATAAIGGTTAEVPPPVQAVESGVPLTEVVPRVPDITDPVITDSLRVTSENSSFLKIIAEHANAVGSTLMANKILFAIVIILAVGALVLKRLQDKRIERHKLGHPLSSEG